MWILLKEVNDYNQYGKYFLAAFLQKPTVQTLQAAFKKNDIDISSEFAKNLIETRGGRNDVEWEWYFLEPYEPLI